MYSFVQMLSVFTSSSRLIPIVAAVIAGAMFGLHADPAFAQRRAEGGSTETRVQLNQVGFYPDAPKRAVVTGVPAPSTFHVIALERGDTLRTGSLGALTTAPHAGDRVRLADFSSVTMPGRYVVDVPGVGRSHPFVIGATVHDAVARAALKGFYFQRVSAALPEAYAGRWQRAAGHPDTSVQVHPSAATAARPAGTQLAAPRGWYDAGDYNKYIVNSGISTATVLSLYEDFPAYADTLRTDIPESSNALPDVLDEALWNVRWMQQMQDPDDGGVYHKLTAASFEGMEVAPAEATAPRYVVQKSTAATLDFAAVMAQASRLFRRFDEPHPARADSFLAAARQAWQWAQANPSVIYDQGRLNEQFDPDIQTGAYGDRTLRDEFIWAAVELFATTGEASFLDAIDLFPDDAASVPNWGDVRTLAYYTLARMRSDPPPAAEEAVIRAEQLLVQTASGLAAHADTAAFRTPMGHDEGDFVWGSNSVAANQGIVLLWAYRLTGDRAYFNHALANLDYLLGRNPTGFSFVTGVGDHTPQYPHHRPSVADDVAEPVPGLLAGGPNPGQQDGCDYPSDLPALSYVDATCSYASNEIAINWNAPLAYLAGAIEAVQHDAAPER